MIDFILKFYSRKVFLDILGDDILGLNSTMMNLLQFLNLAELGIGTAVGFSLYKPLYDNNKDKINEIINLHRCLYQKIGFFIIIGAIILMMFFPLIFEKIDLPLWYPFATFITFLVSVLLSYFINYNQILLSVSQLDYKIQFSYKSWLLIKVLTQIVLVKTPQNPYIWWLIAEMIFSIIASVSLYNTTIKVFPYIKRISDSFSSLKNKNKIIITKIKQVFIHKIAGFALTQTSPIIIYAFISLKYVTLYTNYMVIVTGITMLTNAIFNSTVGAIGNLVAEGNKSSIINVFNEIFTVRFIITILLCFGVAVLSKPFVKLWLGIDYILEDSTVYIISGIMYITISRITVDSFLSAFGQFQDIWSPILETILNIGLSIILGSLFGINGIIGGVLISLVLIVFIWKPIFLFSFGLKINSVRYWLLNMKLFIGTFISFIIWHFAEEHTAIADINSWWEFCYKGGCNILIFCMPLIIYLLFVDTGLNAFIKRIKAQYS